MIRKFVVPFFLLLILGLVVLVKPVQTLALDFLSVFRVNDVQTIKVTMADLEEGWRTIADLKEAFSAQEKESAALLEVISPPQHEIISLAAAEDFTAFKLRLPRELADQTPEISALDPGPVSFVLNLDAGNEWLAAWGAPRLLSENLRDIEMTVRSSAGAYVKYDDLFFSAAQKSYLDAPEAAKQELRDVILELPLIPLNIRQQLAEIETDSSDIYLPVLVGFGQEVDLGGKTGYLYTQADLTALKESFPQEGAEFGAAPESHAAARAEREAKLRAKYGVEEFMAHKEAHHQAMAEMPRWENASLLIWARDGVVYSLIGDKTDTELVQIARSVR